MCVAFDLLSEFVMATIKRMCNCFSYLVLGFSGAIGSYIFLNNANKQKKFVEIVHLARPLLHLKFLIPLIFLSFRYKISLPYQCQSCKTMQKLQ